MVHAYYLKTTFLSSKLPKELVICYVNFYERTFATFSLLYDCAFSYDTNAFRFPFGRKCLDVYYYRYYFIADDDYLKANFKTSLFALEYYYLWFGIVFSE